MSFFKVEFSFCHKQIQLGSRNRNDRKVKKNGVFRQSNVSFYMTNHTKFDILGI